VIYYYVFHKFELIDHSRKNKKKIINDFFLLVIMNVRHTVAPIIHSNLHLLSNNSIPIKHHHWVFGLVALMNFWVSWMRSMLYSSKSAVLVKGTPEPWTSCKRGLRQGDLLSSYLFLLVAETLQCLAIAQVVWLLVVVPTGRGSNPVSHWERANRSPSVFPFK
jgi:hypothetical protein